MRRLIFFTAMLCAAWHPVSAELETEKKEASEISVQADSVPQEESEDAQEALASGRFSTKFSGYVKSLNFITETTGFAPELADFPISDSPRGETAFDSMERLRIRNKSTYDISDTSSVQSIIEYDHEVHFGDFVKTGDFRLARKQSEDRQFLDLSQSLVEKEHVYYSHKLYRAYLSYQREEFGLEIGRQQIPWGIAYFFTPTDVFNAFRPTQIELDERDGTDALLLTSERFDPYRFEFIYTPRGRKLHPQRFMGRVLTDVKGYEVGVLGGRVHRDHVLGFQFQGNMGDAALRGESLLTEADKEKDYLQFTVNMDYNFPQHVLALLEYHFNSRGRRDPKDYQHDLFIRGDIRELARNYIALLLSHDLTPLLTLSNRLIMNADDQSFFIRPEVEYEIAGNLFATAAAQIFAGGSADEYGRAQNLYLAEIKYTF
jgi:hypothetical protein